MMPAAVTDFEHTKEAILRHVLVKADLEGRAPIDISVVLKLVKLVKNSVCVSVFTWRSEHDGEKEERAHKGMGVGWSSANVTCVLLRVVCFEAQIICGDVMAFIG